MSNLVVKAALYGVLLPGVVTAALVVFTRPWRRDANELVLGLVASLAMAVAYAVGHRGLTGKLEVSPIDIAHWLPHIAILAGVLGMVHAALRASLHDSRPGLHALVGAAASLLIGVVVAWLILRPQLAFRYTGMTGVWVTLGVGAAFSVYHQAIERALTGESARVGAAFALVITAAVATCAALSESLLLGQLGGVASAGIGALAVGAMLFNNPALVRALVGFLAITGGAVLALAYFYASMTATAALALALAPALVYAARVIMERVAPSSTVVQRFGWLARAVLLLAVLGFAALSAGHEQPADTGSGEYDYGYE